MDTYGDLVTLLLCFFVLLFAMSTVEEIKYQAFADAMTARFGSPTSTVLPSGSDPTLSGIGEEQPTGQEMDPDQTLPADLTQLEEAITKFIEANDMEAEITVESGESGAVFIRLTNNLLFDGDSSDLRAESIQFLAFLSECFNAVQDQILRVQMNGHTASISGDYPVDDWVLSGQRAGTVASFFEKDGGFDRFKITATEYGRNYPIDDNQTIEGRAANRRVDMVVLGNDTASLQMTMADAMRVYFPGDDTSFFVADGGNLNDLPDTVVDAEQTRDAAISDALNGLTDQELNQIIDDVISTANGGNGAASG